MRSVIQSVTTSLENEVTCKRKQKMCQHLILSELLTSLGERSGVCAEPQGDASEERQRCALMIYQTEKEER